MPDDHALLASWTLAGLGNTGSSFDLNADLGRRVTERALAELPGALAQFPNPLRPNVTGWTLGMVIGETDRQVPVVPARLPADRHVAAAYTGLELLSYVVGHRVAGLRHQDLKRLLRVACIWPKRFGEPCTSPERRRSDHLWPRLSDGAEVDDMLDRRHWIGFVDKRNALSHVATKPGKPTFVDTMDAARTWNQIRLTVVGITQLVCQQVALELTESASRAVRADTWDTLRWDVEVYD